MYLYLAHNAIAAAAEDYRNWRVLGLMPTARGRIAKNHTKIEVKGLDICVATIENADVVEELVKTPELLKSAVTRGEQKLAANNPPDMVVLHTYIGAMHDVLAELPEAYFEKLPVGMANELREVRRATTQSVRVLLESRPGQFRETDRQSTRAPRSLRGSLRTFSGPRRPRGNRGYPYILLIRRHSRRLPHRTRILPRNRDHGDQ